MLLQLFLLVLVSKNISKHFIIITQHTKMRDVKISLTTVPSVHMNFAKAFSCT
jgi:hypothetical protein